jgi:hypothetical protein
MTIQEAIKSGKPFRREHWGIFVEVCPCLGDCKRITVIDETVLDGGRAMYLRADDILATDWEVKK